MLKLRNPPEKKRKFEDEIEAKITSTRLMNVDIVHTVASKR
jgi:hypothetical protein